MSSDDASVNASSTERQKDIRVEGADATTDVSTERQKDISADANPIEALKEIAKEDATEDSEQTEETKKAEELKATQERAKRMPKPPVMPNAVQEAIDKGDAELESQLFGQLQEWANNDLTAEWIPEIESTINRLKIDSKVMGSNGRPVLDKTKATYKISQMFDKRLKALKKEEESRQKDKKTQEGEDGETRMSVKKEKHSIVDPQDLTTIIVSTKNARTNLQIRKDDAKKNLSNVSNVYKNKHKTRGFLHDLRKSLGGESVEPSSYFDFNTENSNITLRISNHNAVGTNFNGDREAISIVIKSNRDGIIINTFSWRVWGV